MNRNHHPDSRPPKPRYGASAAITAVVVGLLAAAALQMSGDAPDLRSLAASALSTCTGGLSAAWMPAASAAL